MVIVMKENVGQIVAESKKRLKKWIAGQLAAEAVLIAAFVAAYMKLADSDSLLIATTIVFLVLLSVSMMLNIWLSFGSPTEFLRQIQINNIYNNAKSTFEKAQKSFDDSKISAVELDKAREDFENQIKQLEELIEKSGK